MAVSHLEVNKESDCTLRLPERVSVTFDAFYDFITKNPLLNGRWFDELDRNRLIKIFV